MKWLIYTILFSLVTSIDYPVRELQYISGDKRDRIQIRSQYPVSLDGFRFSTGDGVVTIWDDYDRSRQVKVGSDILLDRVYWDRARYINGGMLSELVLPKVVEIIKIYQPDGREYLKGFKRESEVDAEVDAEVDIMEIPEYEGKYHRQTYGSLYSGYWNNRGQYIYW